MTIEDLLRDINSAGFCVINLSQWTATSWQASLFTGPVHRARIFQYGHGTSAFNALVSALENAVNNKVQTFNAETVSIFREDTKTPLVKSVTSKNLKKITVSDL